MKHKIVLVTFILFIGLLTNLYLNNWYQRIDVYAAKNYSKDEKNLIIVITDKQTFKKVSGILRDSERMPGILNMAPPQYYMELYKFNIHTKSFLVWIKNESIKGMFVDTKRTEQGYEISEKNTQELKKVIIHKED